MSLHLAGPRRTCPTDGLALMPCSDGYWLCPKPSAECNQFYWFESDALEVRA